MKGWASWPTFWTLLIFAVLFIIFCILEVKVVKAPLIPFSIFKSRTLSGANVVIFLFGMGMFAMWFYISLWLQLVVGLDAIYTGKYCTFILVLFYYWKPIFV